MLLLSKFIFTLRFPLHWYQHGFENKEKWTQEWKQFCRQIWIWNYINFQRLMDRESWIFFFQINGGHRSNRQRSCVPWDCAWDTQTWQILVHDIPHHWKEWRHSLWQMWILFTLICSMTFKFHPSHHCGHIHSPPDCVWSSLPSLDLVLTLTFGLPSCLTSDISYHKVAWWFGLLVKPALAWLVREWWDRPWRVRPLVLPGITSLSATCPLGRAGSWHRLRFFSL